MIFNQPASSTLQTNPLVTTQNNENSTCEIKITNK